MLIIFNQTMYVIELTVGFESSVNANSYGNRANIQSSWTLSRKYDALKFVNISMGTFGMFGTGCDTFVTMLNEVGTLQSQKITY